MLRLILLAIVTIPISVIHEDPRCPTEHEVARRLRTVVAQNWGTLTIEKLLRGWPELRQHTDAGAWPAELGVLYESESGEVVCQFSFLIKQHGGIKSFSLVLSGSRDRALRIGRDMAAALGFSLTRAERQTYERDNSVILRYMQAKPPVGVDIDVQGNKRRSYVAVQGYNFDVDSDR